MDFRRYHMIFEIFLTNNYRIGVKTSIKMIHLYLICYKKLLVSANTSVQFLTEEIGIAKFCNEVFVMPKHLMTKLNKPESSLNMSQLLAIVLFQQ